MMFHGPRFQSHGGVIGGVNVADAPGIDGIALSAAQLPKLDQFKVQREGGLIEFEVQPMLIEASFQNGGLLVMEQEKYSALPIGIAKVGLIRPAPPREELRMRAVLKAVEDNGVYLTDVVVVGEDDAPVIYLSDYRMKAMAPLPSEQVFKLHRD